MVCVTPQGSLTAWHSLAQPHGAMSGTPPLPSCLCSAARHPSLTGSRVTHHHCTYCSVCSSLVQRAGQAVVSELSNAAETGCWLPSTVLQCCCGHAHLIYAVSLCVCLLGKWMLFTAGPVNRRPSCLVARSASALGAAHARTPVLARRWVQ